MNQMRPGGKGRSEIHEMLIRKLLNYGNTAVSIGNHEIWCNVEYLKVAILDCLDETGCRYLLHTQAADAIVEDGKVRGVIVATKQGLCTIRAKVVIDCTGDADIAFFAGAETLKETAELSPMTLCLNVTNAPYIEAKTFSRDRGARREFTDQVRQKYPLFPPEWSLGTFPSSNSFIINHAGTKSLGKFDGTVPEQLTKAEAVSRRQAIEMISAMRELGPDSLRNIELISAGPQVGVRETRRVKGQYILTEEDALSGRTFNDVIAWRSGFLDIGFVRLDPMKIHDVPYGAILPETVNGLLTAGRCISATHVAASAGKSMGNCVATGHAAGLAAALSVRHGCEPRNINVAELQQALQKDGVDLNRGGEEQNL